MEDKQLWTGANHWVLPETWQPLIEHWLNQVTVEDTSEAIYVTVRLDGVQNPGDVTCQLVNGHLLLRRAVQMHSQSDAANGVTIQQMYQRFERMIPLPSSVRWEGREIRVDQGVWKIRLPK